jgi:hypothetical protein
MEEREWAVNTHARPGRDLGRVHWLRSLPAWRICASSVRASTAGPRAKLATEATLRAGAASRGHHPTKGSRDAGAFCGHHLPLSTS